MAAPVQSVYRKPDPLKRTARSHTFSHLVKPTPPSQYWHNPIDWVKYSDAIIVGYTASPGIKIVEAPLTALEGSIKATTSNNNAVFASRFKPLFRFIFTAPHLLQNRSIWLLHNRQKYLYPIPKRTWSFSSPKMLIKQT